MTKPYYHHHTSRVDSPPGGTSVFSSRGDDRKLLKYPKRSWVSCSSSPNAHSSQVLVVLCSVDIHYSTDITSQGAKNDHLTTLQDLGLRPCQDETVLHATFFCFVFGEWDIYTLYSPHIDRQTHSSRRCPTLSTPEQTNMPTSSIPAHNYSRYAYTWGCIHHIYDIHHVIYMHSSCLVWAEVV